MKHSLKAFLTIALTIPAIQADWPNYRGPNRDGTMAGKLDLLQEPEMLWKVNLGGGSRCAIAVSGDRLYTFGIGERNAPNTVCLDAKTGDQLWSTTTGWTDTTPSVADGRVYTLDNDRYVHCLDAASGEVIWKSVQLPDSTERREWGHAGSTLLWEELVIVNVSGGCALNRRTGEVAWSHEGFSGQAAPVLFRHKKKPAVAIFTGDQLVARDPKTGTELWSIPWKTKHGVNACDPLFLDDDQKVLICSGYGLGRALYDLSGHTPLELWNHGQGEAGGTNAYESPIIHRGHMMVFTGRGLVGIDPKDGTAIDGVRTTRASAALSFDSQVLTTTKNGELIIFESDEGTNFEEKVRAQIGAKEMYNVPAYSRGRLYVRTNKGDILGWKIER